MRWKEPIRTIAIAACAALLAVPALAADETTAGDFLRAIAEAKRLPAADAATAAGALRAAGYAIPELDPGARLTEKDVADVAIALGLRVTTTRPDAPFTSDQTAAFLSAFGSEIGAAVPGGGNAAGDVEEELRKGHGHRKGRARSRCEPI